MGNTHSEGALRIELESPDILARQVTGCVHVHMSKAVFADELSLEIVCEERARTHNRVTDRTWASANKHRYTLLRTRVGQLLAPGDYVYPFQWTIPSDFPSAFNMSYSFGGLPCEFLVSSAHISFQLRARLGLPGFSLHCNRDVNVFTPPPRASVPVQRQIRQRISTRQDEPIESIISLNITRNVFAPYDVAKTHVRVRHSAPISPGGNVMLWLIQAVTTEADVEQETTVYRCICERPVGTLDASGAVEGSVALPIANERDNHRAMQVSTCGHICKCEFFLQVVCTYPQGERIVLRTPITVVAKSVVPIVSCVEGPAASPPRDIAMAVPVESIPIASVPSSFPVEIPVAPVTLQLG